MHATEVSFCRADLALISEIAPPGNRIRRTGDCTSCDHELPDRLDVRGILPALPQAATAPGGYRHITHDLGHMKAWRLLLDIYHAGDDADKCYLLSSSGHGSVAYLTSDTPRAHDQPLASYQVALRSATHGLSHGTASLPPSFVCPRCNLPPPAQVSPGAPASWSATL